jgi:regulator of replication initiation timing
MSTQAQIGWHAKYQDTVRELHAARLENDRLQSRLAKVLPERDAQAVLLAQVETLLKEVLKCLS